MGREQLVGDVQQGKEMIFDQLMTNREKKARDK